jgi:hypothetical protein
METLIIAVDDLSRQLKHYPSYNSDDVEYLKGFFDAVRDERNGCCRILFFLPFYSHESFIFHVQIISGSLENHR